MGDFVQSACRISFKLPKILYVLRPRLNKYSQPMNATEWTMLIVLSIIWGGTEALITLGHLAIDGRAGNYMAPIFNKRRSDADDFSSGSGPTD